VDLRDGVVVKWRFGVEELLFTSKVNDTAGTLPGFVTLKFSTLVEHGVSGRVSGVPAPSELRSKTLEVVEDEPELDAEGAVARF